MFGRDVEVVFGGTTSAGTISVTPAQKITATSRIQVNFNIKDTPVGLPLDLEIGRAMDLAVDVRVVEDKETPSGGFTRLRVDIANDKPERVTLEYRQVRHRESMRVTDASRRAGEKNGEPLWTFRLAPGERATLTYTLTYRDD